MSYIHLNPRNDLAFKQIFGQEKTQDILQAMLNAVLEDQLEHPIVEIRLGPTGQNPKSMSLKESIVDVMCIDQEGRRLIVEMQVKNFNGFEKRAVYYASKAYTGQALRGDEYAKLKEVIFLSFCDYSVLKGQSNWQEQYIISDKTTASYKIKELSFTFVDLPKFRELHQDKPLSTMTLKEKFCYLIAEGEKITPQKLQELTTGDPIIGKAFEQLNMFYYTEPMMNTYERIQKKYCDERALISQAKEEGFAKGEKKGHKRGIVEGEKKGHKRGIVEGEKKGRAELLKELLEKNVISVAQAQALSKL